MHLLIVLTLAGCHEVADPSLRWTRFGFCICIGGACVNALPPAATLWADPPSKVGRASSVLTGLTSVLDMIPFCSGARAERLQGVAFASSMPSTEWTACLGATSAACRRSSPAVLFPCWALGAEPEDLLAAPQCHFVRRVPLSGISLFNPLS